jgi:tetratricopeptide (TPR) repeat protein
MNAILLLEERRLEAALDAAERYGAGRHEDALHVLALGTRAKTEVLLGNHDAARRTLEKIGDILRRAGLVPPWHLSAYTVAQLRWDLAALEAAASNGASSLRQLRAQAKKDARRALRIAKVVAGVRVETYRLVGRLHWLRRRPQRAFAWWARALHEAERLDAVPELARTCLEIGLRARAAGSTGVDAGAQVTRARGLLGEIGLAWDLAQLDAADQRDPDHAAMMRI